MFEKRRLAVILRCVLPIDPKQAVDRLIEFGRAVRRGVIRSRAHPGSAEAVRATAADTIYAIDTAVEPILEEFCREWSRTVPLVLVAEGIEGDGGVEGIKVFPEGARESDAVIRLLVDPIDGTRGIMYDKRPAWSLAGVAPNKGAGTRLRDIEAAVMIELPTSKMGYADVISAVRGSGMRAQREETGDRPRFVALSLRPSEAQTIDHGFASISNFFPGTKVLASQVMEHLVGGLIGPADVTRATVFEDQYISTGGQFFELIAGHDRFNADLRPLFYRAQGMPQGMCCHPYDCAALLIAEEAGVIITDGDGQPLDAPMDVTTGVSWIGYANSRLRARIEPVLLAYLRRLAAGEEGRISGQNASREAG